jgi:hypothetical protein
MNLRSFLDQDVLVQFRGPWHMVVSDPNGQPTIAMTRTPPPQRDRDKVSLVQLASAPPPEAPQVTPLYVPFAQGRFVDIGGDVFFSYVPEPTNGRRIDVQFHPDAIFSVSMVRREPLAST